MEDGESRFLAFLDSLETVVVNSETVTQFLDIMVSLFNANELPSSIVEKLLAFLDNIWQEKDIDKFNIAVNKMAEIIDSAVLAASTYEHREYIIFTLNSISISLRDCNYYVEEDEEYSDDVDDILSNISKLEEKLNHNEERMKDLIPQAITAVGIFAAVIVVIFGGLEIINAFAALKQHDTIKMLVISGFMGMMIFDCLFLLMFLLARISGRPIHTVCGRFCHKEIDKNTGKPKEVHGSDRICMYCSFNNERDNEEAKQCSHVMRAFVKYPYFYFSNFFIIVIEVVLFAIWIMGYLLDKDYVAHLGLLVTFASLFVIAFISCGGYFIATLGKVSYMKPNKKTVKNDEVTKYLCESLAAEKRKKITLKPIMIK